MSLIKKRKLLSESSLKVALVCHKHFRTLDSMSPSVIGRVTTKIPTTLLQQSVEKFILTNCYTVPDIYYRYISRICEVNNFKFSVVVEDLIEIDEDVFEPHYYITTKSFDEIYSKDGFKLSYIHIETVPYKIVQVFGPLTSAQNETFKLLNTPVFQFDYLEDDD